MDYKDFTIQKNKEDHFWYKARRKLINNLFSLVFKDYNPNRSILEIGCGTGSQVPILEKWGRVEGLDINPDAINIARKNGFNVEVGDVEKSEIGQAEFETICLFDVLEHLKSDNDVVQKVYQALKSNGFLFLTAPAYNFIFSDHDRAMEHFRRYDKKALLSMLQNSGFQIVQIGYWNFFMFPGIFSMRLFKNFLSLFIKKREFQSESSNLHTWFNNFLYRILMFENFLIKKNIKFGWGLSIFVIAKKL